MREFLDLSKLGFRKRKKPPDADLTHVYKLAYQEAQERVRDQISAIDSLRSRTSTIVATSALTLSFLGKIALQDQRPQGPIAWVVILSFSVTVFFGALILKSDSNWRFHRSGKLIIRELGKKNKELPQWKALEQLTLLLEKDAEHNERRLRFRHTLFTASLTGLAVQVLALLAILWRWS